MKDIFSLKELVLVLKKRWKMIVSITILAMTSTGLITYFLLTPLYQSSTLLLVNQSKEEGDMYTSNELRTNMELINTYNVIITSSRILEGVVKELSLDQTAKTLRKRIGVENEGDSQVISIRVKDENPELAMQIANTMAEVFQREITEIMNVNNVSILTTAEVAEVPVSPNFMLNTVIGILAGLMFSIGLSLLIEFLDNKVRTEEEIECILEMPILGSVPVISKKQGKLNPSVAKNIPNTTMNTQIGEGENSGS